MDIPFSSPHISLLCGTNNLCSHSPTTIYSTITEIIFLLQQRCESADIHYFQFYHNLITLIQKLLVLTLLFIFRFKKCFQNLLFFHGVPSTLYNQNMYRADKLHLTDWPSLPPQLRLKISPYQLSLKLTSSQPELKFSCLKPSPKATLPNQCQNPMLPNTIKNLALPSPVQNVAPPIPA